LLVSNKTSPEIRCPKDKAVNLPTFSQNIIKTEQMQIKAILRNVREKENDYLI